MAILPIDVGTLDFYARTGEIPQNVRDALAKVPALEGVFCNNDDIALGVLFECHRASIAVPTPNQPGSMTRDCDHESTHGIARRSSMLRVGLREAGRLPMLALTADPPAEVEDRCREAGFDAVIRKPFETRRLLGMVEALRGRSDAVGREPARAQVG